MPEAIKYFLIAYNSDQDNPEYIYNLSRAYYLIEDFKNAEPFLKKCIEVDIPNLEKSICAAKLSAALSNKKESIYFMNIAHNLQPTNPHYSYALAKKHQQNKNFTMSEKLLYLCLDAENDSIMANNIMTHCDSALESLYLEEKLGKIDYIKLGFCYYSAYNALPSNILYIYKYAKFLFSIKEYSEAIELLEECIDLDAYAQQKYKIKAECANLWGNIAITVKKNTSQAAELYSLAKKLDLSNPIYNYNLALIYYTSDYNCTITAKLLRECLQGKNQEYFSNIGKAICANKLATLYYNGKLGYLKTPDVIIDYYKLACELNPNNTAYKYNLAITYFYAGEHAETAKILKECKENIQNDYSHEMQMDCSTKYSYLIGLFITEIFFH